MARFGPIAIVGRACLLPGADSPDALWRAVVEGRDLLSSAPPGRWGLSRRHAMGTGPDRTWSDRGGYVRGFEERFDPTGFAVDPDTLRALDPVFLWALHTAREALRDARVDDPSAAGLILGNLSFPSASMARYAERVWVGDRLADAAGVPRVGPRNRFMSGLPALLCARALGLGRSAFALDAACASSLVATKLACDRLHDGHADLMLAGAVNCADDLFIHVGFCALGALSQSGRSRPFHADADGLVPAEGAAILVLERLEDAVRHGRRIHGVIRGVGLSNDGRGAGLLVPSQRGQVRAMAAAYEQAGWRPSDVGLIECHATGTQVGDRTEIASLSEVLGDSAPVPIGSLKSNLGHLITAAGAAGLIKVLSAMEHGQRPPTLWCDPEHPALQESPLRVLREPEPWDGPRRAAVSAFGFGGNNAHLLVEAWEGGDVEPAALEAPGGPLAVVGLSERLDPAVITLPLGEVRFPPRDLEQTLPQQLLVMEVALEATAAVRLDPDRTSVAIGMGCDPAVARYGARWRAADWVEAWGLGDLDAVREALSPALASAGVLGTMPNIPANRLNSQLDLRAASLSVSAEELSGVRALQIGARALRAGEIDAAVIGAVDLSRDPVHEQAARALGLTGEAADGAVVLVLKRLADAQADGDPVIAILDDVPADAFATPAPGAHAAAGLLQVTRAVRALPEGAAGRLELTGMGGQQATVCVVGGPAPSPSRAAAPARPLHFEPHPRPLRLPALEPRPLTPIPAPLPVPTGRERMRAAPSLAPTLEPEPHPAPPAPTPAAIPTLAPTPTAAHAPSPQPSGGISPHHARLAQVHTAFLEQQAEVQQRFLELRSRAAEQLLQAYARRAGLQPPPPTPVVAPLPPARPARPAPLAPAPVATAPTAPAARPEPPPPPAQAMTPVGLQLDREQLKVHAAGRISTIFGDGFEPQDGYARQVRMPTPPLLLADRVCGLEAEPRSMGTGTIWTETDVREDSWYLHDGRMPAGLMIEAGQADLMLISYLGIDLLNRGERVYRLLGCELTYHGGLPAPGETLRYAIHVDGHARQGDIRLFFFHYDCRVLGAEGDGARRLSVREGQAGFFTEEELTASMGVLWSAEEASPAPGARVDPPRVACQRNRLDRAQLEAFADGRVARCFGPGFEAAGAHTRTPRIAGGRLLLLDEVTHLEPRGGPWGRGYLRAVDAIAPDDWFFDGHFHNDPCMPGTLMFEGCLQAMAVLMTSYGYSLERDGWRFEPVEEQPYLMRCRGEVDRSSRELIYEVFVEEVHDGPHPTLYADLLCTVDGLKAFHCRRMGLKLAPGAPMDSRPDLALAARRDTRGPVAEHEGFRFDYESLLACAWGRPSRAFGPPYARFDTGERVARLPGPPYHFMSRVTRVDGELWRAQAGARVEIEYDVPLDEWYFRENGAPTMPFCVLLEAALQPCGWLASAVGSALSTDEPLYFRNLDGTGTLTRELTPGDSTLTTRVHITGVSQSAGMIIESFDVECLLDGVSVYNMKTVFGFFPGAALANQVGLTSSDEQRALLTEPCDRSVDLTVEPARFCGGAARLAAPFLRMLDRVTGIWPDGGAQGLGRYRGEKDVDPNEWFFKSHFHQDPVQPGSLGIEALIQLLQFAMLDKGMDAGVADPRFEPLMLDAPLTWKYRGQVRLHNKRISSTLDIVEQGADERGPYAVATASLWVDGMRIYEASNLGMRIVSGPATEERWAHRLDLEAAPWLGDHRPTWTVPALPMMSMVDLVAQAALGSGRVVRRIEKLTVHRWLAVPDAVELTWDVRRSGERAEVVLRAGGDPVATGVVHLGNDTAVGAAPWPALEAPEAPDPYATGALFHGPAFQALRRLRSTTSPGPRGEGPVAGASAWLDASPGSVPVGALNPRLLDAATHAIPHDRLDRWCADLSSDQVAYPALLLDLTLHGPTPTAGEVRCEVRFDGFFGGPRFPAFRVQLIAGDRLWAAFRLVEALFPKGPLGAAEPAARRAFLRDRRYVEGVALSRTEAAAEGTETVLRIADVDSSDWLPGTVEALYGTRDPAVIGEREHVARRVGVHPGRLPAALPLTRCAVAIDRTDPGVIRVRDGAPERLDIAPVRAFWTEWFGRGPWPVEDLYYGLIERFVRRVIVVDRAAFEAVRGRSLLFVANHQVAVESLLFSVLASGLTGVPTVTLAKAEHRTTWLGRLIAHCFDYPGVRDPRVITFFDREDRESLRRIIGGLAAEMAGPGRSVMVHIEGTRSLECRTPVQKMSGAFIDMALQVGAPIVPVRFTGALPIQALERRIEFPVSMGKQDLWFGSPLLPEELSSLHYGERKRRVIEAINALGPANAVEGPIPPDPAFAARVETHRAASGASEEHAVLLEILRDAATCTESAALLANGGFPDDPPLRAWLVALAARLHGAAE